MTELVPFELRWACTGLHRAGDRVLLHPIDDDEPAYWVEIIDVDPDPEFTLSGMDRLTIVRIPAP